LYNSLFQTAFFNDYVQPACLPEMDSDPRTFYAAGGLIHCVKKQLSHWFGFPQRMRPRESIDCLKLQDGQF
jgi:hypothetical protein